MALWRGEPVRYGGMPTGGLFRRCRQPIYLGFALVLWTAPVWSPDWLALAVAWCCHCVIGPLLKFARWARRFGPKFVHYQSTVSYFLPRVHR